MTMRFIQSRLMIIVVLCMAVAGCPGRQTSSGDPSQTQLYPLSTKELAEQEYAIGFEFMLENRYDNAIRHFEEAVRLDSTQLKSYWALATIYIELNDNEKALSLYKQLCISNPSNPQIYVALGAYYAQIEDYNAAVNTYKKGLTIDSTDVDLLNGLALVHACLRNFEQSLVIFGKVLAHDSTNVTALRNAGRINYVRHQPEKALQYYKRLLINPLGVSSVVVSEYADVLIALQCYEEALMIYDSLLVFEPENVNLLIKSGLILQKQKQYTEATKRFEIANQFEPENTQPLLCIAEIDLEQGNLINAKGCLDRVVDIDPDNTRAHMMLGDLYFNWAKAAEDEWYQNRVKENCSTLFKALDSLMQAIQYYQKACNEEKLRKYSNNQIERCQAIKRALEEDKWFYCK